MSTGMLSRCAMRGNRLSATAVRKRRRLSGLSDGNSSGSAPSLKKETKKEVCSGQGVMPLS